MSVLLSHPTTGHAHYVADSLYKAGLLGKFVLSFHYRRDGWIEKSVSLMPNRIRGRLERELNRRRRTQIPETFIETCPEIEIFNRIYQKAWGLRADKHWGYRRFDRHISTLIDKDNYSAVYGFLTSCQLTHRKAGRLGLKTITDMPICHWNTGRALLKEEYRRYGAGADYQDAFPWSEHQNSEMDEELESADLIIAGSEFVSNSLIVGGISAEKVSVIPYGVEADRFTPKNPETSFHFERRRNHDRKFRLIFVGTVTLRKGILDLLEAMRILGPFVELTMVGKMQLPKSVKSQTWPANIRHISNVPFQEVASLLRDADAYVFPSLFEGSSLSIYEAMASALPVVTTPNSGSVIRNGIDGLIVSIRSPQQIVSAIHQLMDDQALWERLSIEARKRACHYSWSTYAGTLGRTVQNLIFPCVRSENMPLP